MLKNLLLNKNIYGIKYFIDDMSLIKHLNVIDIQLYKIGTTRRLDLCFSLNKIEKYNYYKYLCAKESSFVNISCKNGLFCASFIADKRFNCTLDMLINSNSIDCISKERILELCETL